MRQFLRVALLRHRWTAFLAGLLTLVVGAVARGAFPETWRVEADVYVAEPAIVHRLANPFATVPSTKDVLQPLIELLYSDQHITSLVKDTALVDRWKAGRPWPMLAKDALQERFRPPLSDRDQLAALVAMVEKKLEASVEGHHVRLAVQWTSPELALDLTRATVRTLVEQRETSEGKALDAAAKGLDEQLAGVRAEMKSRVERLDQEITRARYDRRLAAIDADREQLFKDQQRAADLLVRAEEKHLGAEIIRRVTPLRALVVKPPTLPRDPIGGPPALRWLVLLLAALASALGGALVMALFGGEICAGFQIPAGLGIPVLATARIGWIGYRQPARWQAVVLVGGLALATGAAAAFAKGNVALALAPWLAAGALYATWVLPLKYPLMGLMLLAITLDDPQDRPYFNLWQSPLFPVGKIFFKNVAWFTGFELSLLFLGGLALLRWFRPQQFFHKDPFEGAPPKPLRYAVGLSLVSVFWLIAWGVAQGGVFREALWQFRVLMMMPIAATLAMHAFEFPKDFKPLLWILLIGTVLKSLLGTYFIYRIAVPMGEVPPHTTGHNDTMIFVTATVVGLVMLWEHPKAVSVRSAAVLLPFAANAMRLNDRRIAYVDIAIVLIFVYLISPWHLVKRASTRAFGYALPFLLVYMAAGWNSNSGVFKPVAKVRSIVAPSETSEENSSNVERDIENYNLLKNWEMSPVLGRGFGHAFSEFVPSNDFAQSNYGHVGHNSVLWLLWIGGIAGFTGVWLYLGVAAYFMGRALLRTRKPLTRAGLLSALGIMLTYVLQAFGDMGTQSIQMAFFVSVALAIIGRTATQVGAWSYAPALAADAEPTDPETAPLHHLPSTLT